MGSVQLDNANPTILSASDLPSHRQRRKGQDEPSKKHGVRDVLMAKPSYALDPFYLSDFSDTDSDDSTVEPIDEQEIYGEIFRYCLNFLSACSYSIPCKGPGNHHYRRYLSSNSPRTTLFEYVELSLDFKYLFLSNFSFSHLFQTMFISVFKLQEMWVCF